MKWPVNQWTDLCGLITHNHFNLKFVLTLYYLSCIETNVQRFHILALFRDPFELDSIALPPAATLVTMLSVNDTGINLSDL